MPIQNEKPNSPRRIAELLNDCCKFVVNIIAQTPQENKTKNIIKSFFFIDKIQHTAE